MKRYFVDFVPQGEFALTGSEYNHMANVMRSRPGEQVIVCNGDGIDYLCEILGFGKREAALRLLSSERNRQECGADVTVFLGLLKGDNTELEIQKLSELGVRRAVPFVSANTVARADRGKIERFNRVAAESAKQCGRASILRVEPCLRFAEVLKAAGEYGRAVLCYENENGRGLAEALAGAAGQRIALVVGSEGGFTPEEAEAAREAGFVSASLGKRILRAETAAIAAAAATMFALGELGGRP